MVKKTKQSGTETSFESSALKLESILETLENEGTGLEEALKAFEQGVTLLRESQRSLALAEQRVNTLLEANNEPRVSPANDTEQF